MKTMIMALAAMFAFSTVSFADHHEEKKPEAAAKADQGKDALKKKKPEKHDDNDGKDHTGHDHGDHKH